MLLKVYFKMFFMIGSDRIGNQNNNINRQFVKLKLITDLFITCRYIYTIFSFKNFKNLIKIFDSPLVELFRRLFSFLKVRV